MLLGVIVRDITDPFFAGAIEAASLEANRRGYNVVLGHAHRSADEAEALWAILEARHCDALLFLGDLRDRPDLIEDLQKTSIPVVALWHGSRESGIPTVGVDNRSGIAAVVDHLVGLGHVRIAFAGPQRLGDITEREDAYLAVTHGHGLVIPDDYRQETCNDYGGGAAAFDRLMDLDAPPTAIVAPTVNSYKRLTPGYEAPTNIAWSASNRSAMIRIPARRGVGPRTELRMPDPSCNPYLALAVILAAGVDGIERNLVPPPAIQRNIYQMTVRDRRKHKIRELPGTLREALVTMQKDRVVRQALGDHVFAKFITAKTTEFDAYRIAVHRWELDNYLAEY